MVKSIHICFLSSLFILINLFAPQNLFGQKTILSEDASLKIGENVFGGNYEYVSNDLIVSDHVISGDAMVSYKSGNLIKLKTGFKVEKNSHFKAQIVKNTDITKISEATPDANLFEVYPNVSSGTFNINFTNTDNNCTLNIYNTSGVLIYSVSKIKPGLTKIDLSDYPKGVYFIKADLDNRSCLEKIILK
jgi:hypothetical protein